MLEHINHDCKRENNNNQHDDETENSSKSSNGLCQEITNRIWEQLKPVEKVHQSEEYTQSAYSIVVLELDDRNVPLYMNCNHACQTECLQEHQDEVQDVGPFFEV